MANYAYVRVSTREQNIDRQLAALEPYNIPKKNIFCDYQSGKDFDRPCLSENAETAQGWRPSNPEERGPPGPELQRYSYPMAEHYKRHRRRHPRARYGPPRYPGEEWKPDRDLYRGHGSTDHGLFRPNRARIHPPAAGGRHRSCKGERKALWQKCRPIARRV